MNFKDIRQQGAKREAQIRNAEDKPSERGYSASPTQYKGENDSSLIDIVDSGSKGTIVNKPNGAYSKVEPLDNGDIQKVALRHFKGGR